MSTIRQNDDLLLNAALQRRLTAEAEFEYGPGLWWAVVCKRNGMTVPMKSGPAVVVPTEDQQVFAHDMARLLNKEIHHDGSWVVAFTHPSGAIYALPEVAISMTIPYERWVFLWLDADGDVQFPVDCVQPFVEVIHAGPSAWIETAEASWQAWHKHMREVLGIKPKDEAVTYKRAQGQERPSGNKPFIAPVV